MATEREFLDSYHRMRQEMDELLGDIFGGGGSRTNAAFPAVDVYYAEDPPMLVIEAALAGVSESEVELAIQSNVLVLSGYRKLADPEGCDRRVYQQVEIPRGSFRREIPLPPNVTPENSSARFEAGILRIELPLTQRIRETLTVRIERDSE